MKRRHYVVIGSGIAALRAAETIRSSEGGAQLTLVSAEPHAFYSRPGLAYFLARELPEARLAIRTRAEVRELGLERITDTAVALDPVAHQLRLRGGQVLRYDRLLLATGAESVPPPFRGAPLSGVVQLDGLDDARAIAAQAVEGRRAVVTGGGSTALELAEAFAARGLRTHYLLRGERYWPRVLDAAESARVQAGLERAGIALIAGEAVAEAESDGQGHVRAVLTASGRRLRCDVVAVAVGIRPRTGLARAAGLEVGRGIVVDDELRTSDPDIYAAGDAAQLGGGGRPALDTLWSSAARQGQVAGSNLAGGSARYVPSVALNVTRLAGITTTIVGEIGGEADQDLQSLTRGQSERWHGADAPVCVRQPGTLRLCISSGRLAGAIVMGDGASSRAAVELVGARVRVNETRLSEWRAKAEQLPTLLSAFHGEWLRSAAARESIHV